MRKILLILALSLGATSTFAQDTLRKVENYDLGKFSISLAVEDIAASYEFYQKLGFTHLEGAGAVEQKWMILVNGTNKIGLFQGMFPTNTITFNPNDARTIYSDLTKDGIKPVYQVGMDTVEGPCSFSILDPDGNPVLIDQH
jgi:catechol 2,3-dioxygenase-like lactoylglutathione lyase family enzyme